VSKLSDSAFCVVICALVSLLSVSASANYSAVRSGLNIGSWESDFVADLHAIYPWDQVASSATRQPPPILLAWCQAMGGYPSYEAYARAQARASRAQANTARTQKRERAQEQARIQAALQQQQRAQVMSEQTALQNLGYYTGALDGRSGPVTRAAIEGFQRENGLPVTGALDWSSRNLLTLGSPKRQPASSAPSTSDRQKILADQKMLQQHGYYTGAVDGQSGPAMRAAIAEFREAHDLGLASTLNAKTRAVLSGDSVLPKVAWDANKNKQVIRDDQRALADLGYYAGPIDGLRGSKTVEAVRKFRQDNALAVVDERAALRKAHADLIWLRNANGDGVSLIRLARYKDGYRVQTANGDYAYASEGAGQVRKLAEDILKDSNVQRVYIDVSSLTPKQIESFRDTLKLRPSSQAQLLDNAVSRDLLFSRAVTLAEPSPPSQLPTGLWRSTIKLSSSAPVQYVLHIIGKTKEMTNAFVQRLLKVHSGDAAQQSTLSRSLLKVRKELNVSDDDIRDEFSNTIELMSIPRLSSVRDA
jgi:peptidoglycan hydrolase-like protein with peptidoglycan-binding domain